ncbi:hypothetical protein GF412_03360 [Candidatus Micrarchaeota archaeon]|nr:hypothetical protein [Candidatus Micrarchaeota archaeon]MBD3417990.1 hypothetical protein [Candidatus Micrarchaeota archaeon]
MGKELEVARYILERHKEEIERGEIRSLSRLRQIISPYSEYVSSLKSSILEALAPYKKEEKFLDAARRVISHCSGIEIVELPVQYSLSFEEMEQLGASSRIDKALLATSLLRSLGTETAFCVVGHQYSLVKFNWLNKPYAIDLDRNELLEGGKAEEFIKNSHPTYIFNDLSFEFGQ